MNNQHLKLSIQSIIIANKPSLTVHFVSASKITHRTCYHTFCPNKNKPIFCLPFSTAPHSSLVFTLFWITRWHLGPFFFSLSLLDVGFSNFFYRTCQRFCGPSFVVVEISNYFSCKAHISFQICWKSIWTIYIIAKFTEPNCKQFLMSTYLHLVAFHKVQITNISSRY